jgi:hypothetical protein
MAEFSKQYQDALSFDWNDFDYGDIFEGLRPNESVSQICEGLGTLAVAKSEDGRMLLGVESEEDPEYIQWITLETAIERTRNRNTAE